MLASVRGRRVEHAKGRVEALSPNLGVVECVELISDDLALFDTREFPDLQS